MRSKRKENTTARVRRDRVKTSPQEILNVAAQLFLRWGYHGTSTTNICEALGISRSSLYWYYKDKEDILFTLHKQRIESSVKPLVAELRSEPDPLRRLETFIRRLTELICTEPESKILIQEIEYLNHAHQKWVRAAWKDQLEMLRDMIRELKHAGKVKDVSETFMAFSLIGMISWAYNWFDYSRPEGTGRLAQEIQEVFLRGMLRTVPSDPIEHQDQLDDSLRNHEHGHRNRLSGAREVTPPRTACGLQSGHSENCNPGSKRVLRASTSPKERSRKKQP